LRTGRPRPGARGLRRHEGCGLGRRQVRRSLLRRVRPGRGPAAHHWHRGPAPEGRAEPDARGAARERRHAAPAGARLLEAQGADRRRRGARRGLRAGHPPPGRRLAAARRPGDALAAAGRDLARLALLGEPAAMKVDFKVSADAAGQRLDKFLRKRLDNLPLSHLYKLVRTKKVRVNGARAAIAQLLQPGDEITVHVLQAAQAPPPKPAASVRQDFKVLYEDEHILAADKPAGLAKGSFQREEGSIDLRLAEHQQTYASKRQRGVNLQNALTRWRKLAGAPEATLLELTIETGRTHQIRRHLEAIGHPVVGDSR